jgi:hypothetical protein
MNATAWKSVFLPVMGVAAMLALVALAVSLPIVVTKVLGITLMFVIMVLGGAVGASTRVAATRVRTNRRL